MHDSATRWTGSTTTSQVTISDSSRVRTSVIALIPPSQASRTTLLMPSDDHRFDRVLSPRADLLHFLPLIFAVKIASDHPAHNLLGSGCRENTRLPWILLKLDAYSFVSQKFQSRPVISTLIGAGASSPFLHLCSLSNSAIA